MSDATSRRNVGRRQIRLDGAPKVRGEAAYLGDRTVPGLLHGAVLHSPHPHALIRRLDTRRALRCRACARSSRRPSARHALRRLHQGRDGVRTRPRALRRRGRSGRRRGHARGGAGRRGVDRGRLRSSAGRVQRRGSAAGRRAARPSGMGAVRGCADPGAPRQPFDARHHQGGRRRGRLREILPYLRASFHDIESASGLHRAARLHRLLERRRQLRGLVVDAASLRRPGDPGRCGGPALRQGAGGGNDVGRRLRRQADARRRALRCAAGPCGEGTGEGRQHGRGGADLVVAASTGHRRSEDRRRPRRPHPGQAGPHHPRYRRVLGFGAADGLELHQHAARPLQHPERAAGRRRGLHEQHDDAGRFARRRDRPATSPPNRRWTSSPIRWASIRWSCACATSSAKATRDRRGPSWRRRPRGMPAPCRRRYRLEQAPAGERPRQGHRLRLVDDDGHDLRGRRDAAIAMAASF